MVPGRYDISVYKGSTLDTTITGTDSAGASIDFSVYTEMRMQVRPYWSDGLEHSYISLTMTGGGITVAADGLSIQFNMTALATEALTFKTGKYDLELVIEEAGEADIVHKLLYGKFSVVPEVTV